jgi:hypothetical protein
MVYGLPGEGRGANGAQVLVQSPPCCPRLFALMSSRQSPSGLMCRDHILLRRKLITTAAVEPQHGILVACQLPMQ